MFVALIGSTFYNPHMEEWLEAIEQELLTVLPRTVDHAWVERVFGHEVPLMTEGLFDEVCAPARDLLYSGGKRWRPLLMLLTAKMLGGQRAFDKAMRFVPLVELPHNGSLIIDDIEDQSDLRRGLPATHITHGIDLSINAGTFLFYLPTMILEDADITDAERLGLYRIYSKYMRKIHLGQGMDIVWHHGIETIPDIGAYETMCRLKTGCLAAMGSEMGAALATDNQWIIGEAGLIAETIGLGFQVLDDVINLEKGNPGKQRGDDIVENKKSLPIILYANAHPKEKPHLFSVFRKAQTEGYGPAKDDIIELIDRMVASKVLEQARDHAHELFLEVLRMIEGLYRPSQDRDLLVAMINGFLQA